MSRLLKTIPIILVAINAVVFFRLVGYDAAAGFDLRVSGMDDRPERQARSGPVKIEGQLSRFDVEPGQSDGRWVRFRGPLSDGIAADERQLARSWPAEGPGLVWSLEVGEGYASAAVYEGKVYVIDYDQDRRGDLIRCLSLDTGEDLWQYFYPVDIRRNHGMSRTVPVVNEDYVVTMGPMGHVTALDRRTGEFMWMLNLEAEFGTTIPHWYAGQCPLIDDQGRVILAPAGDEVLMMAVDVASGEIVWQSPNDLGWDMTHSSVIPMEFNGRDTYVYCGSGGVVGVCADSGEILWHTTGWRIRIAMVPSPVIIGDDRIFLTGGYNAGSAMLQLVEEDGRIEAVELFRLDAREFASEQQTPVYYQGHIFAVRPDGRLACLDVDGNVVWTSDRGRNFGLGPFLVADGLIYVLDDYGVLTLVEASTQEYRQLDQAQVIADGHDAWGPMTLVDGRLILRDMTVMKCVEVR